ncbi:MAG TPA: hypothetical protein VK968_09885, partial [Roseimicrobium sp.]|nr:hypothetical protein [Roseimicrobium sp.]
RPSGRIVLLWPNLEKHHPGPSSHADSDLNQSPAWKASTRVRINHSQTGLFIRSGFAEPGRGDLHSMNKSRVISAPGGLNSATMSSGNSNSLMGFDQIGYVSKQIGTKVLT